MMRASVEIIRDTSRWDAIAAEWSALFASCAHASVPQSCTWQRAWWDVYGAAYGADGAPAILTVRRAGELIGVLPLYRHRSRRMPLAPTTLVMLSSGEDESEESCAEYLDLLCRDEDADECIEAIAAALRTLRWQRIRLPMLDARSALPRLASALAGDADVNVRDAGACRIAELDEGFDSFIARLGYSHRKRMRRILREADPERVRLVVARGEDAHAAFDALGALHQRHWTTRGESGCFAAPRWVAFHRAMLPALVAERRVLLALLEVDGVAVAAIYGFLAHGSFHYYQAGVSREPVPGVSSPGILAILLLMRELAAEGLERYDFLRGRTRYKLEMSTTEQGLIDIEIWRNTRAARAWRAIYPLWSRVLRRLGLASH